MFTFQLKENFFDLIEEFLNLLNQRDFKQLEIKFQLNKNVKIFQIKNYH